MKPSLCILLLFHTGFLFSQNNYDNTWVLGYNPNDSISYFGGTRLTFSNAHLQLSFFNIPFDMDAGSASISNADGRLMFYSNGCRVADGLDRDMPNGDDINPGAAHEEWCETGDDHPYTVHQGMLCLPWPGKDSVYAMFHLAWGVGLTFPYRKTLNTFYYSVIDMAQNNGLGAVTDKNHLLLQDTSFIDNISAVRHGNGRDWWLLLPKSESDTMYLFLFTPQGIIGPKLERTGLKTDKKQFTAGQVTFSPDGSKYCRAMSDEGVDIYDFDRCAGRFLSATRIPFPPNPDYPVLGAAVSANSRYLYACSALELYQFDLWAKDIAASETFIGKYDFFVDTFHTQPAFGQMKLAPDRRIYMTSPNTVRFLHVIDFPDSAGAACGFRQRGLKLYTHHGFCLPNFPYFNLFDLKGSPCDSLGIDAPGEYQTLYTPDGVIRLTPNPAAGMVTAALPPWRDIQLYVYNVAGVLIEKHQVNDQRKWELDCTNWPAGVYIVTAVSSDGRRPVSGKLVVR